MMKKVTISHHSRKAWHSDFHQYTIAFALYPVFLLRFAGHYSFLMYDRRTLTMGSQDKAANRSAD